MPLIDEERLDKLFLTCLYDPKVDTSDMVVAKGVGCTVGFAQERLDEYAAEIAEMLHNLPDDFQEGRGNGASFVNACVDRNGDFWTGLHRRMDQLFQLGTALKLVCDPFGGRLPPEKLPGGVPYYQVRREASREVAHG